MSCEEAIDVPNPFETVLPCVNIDNIEDFCSISIVDYDSFTRLIVNDNYFPDFGEIEYICVIQHINDGQYQCTTVYQSNMFQIDVPSHLLNDSRVCVIRTVIGEDGTVFSQTQSNFFRFYNGKIL